MYLSSQFLLTLIAQLYNKSIYYFIDDKVVDRFII
jgi:hypothetical protein